MEKDSRDAFRLHLPEPVLSTDAPLLASCPFIHKRFDVGQDLLIILGCKQQSGIKGKSCLQVAVCSCKHMAQQSCSKKRAADP